jgi:monofunctional glycosyltransferase
MHIQPTYGSIQNPPVSAPSYSLWQLGCQKLLFALKLFMMLSVVIVLLFRWIPLPTSAFMLYRHFEDISEQHTFHPIRYHWVSYTDISPHASRAVIASEDQTFYHHSGFDIASIKKALLARAKGGKLRGASTISQQVAKNVFLTPTKSFLRKGIEAWFTFLIESFWTKERILEVYLNIAEFGDHLFGINEASYQYFGMPPNKINPAQAALLAATLPNPKIYLANRPSNYVFKRQRWILKQMRNLG